MLYNIIKQKRNRWLQSEECTVKELLVYIEQQGFMRDAQIEAIKTYLFLKIACGNQPLWRLFAEGKFNTLNIDDLSLTVSARQTMANTPAAVALLEYARLKDRKGKQLAPELEKFINANPADIDYKKAFKDLFYGVDYTDYLFSLPMGAGKTYLMAAFIYLDLYFAQNEPNNKVFAHNFIIFAPSGLKSSVIPSLKTIQKFNPAWIIPEPRASELKKLVKFEVLDAQKSQNKSNKTKNPNTQKLNMYQPLDDLMGLVAVTNAEKVILDKVFDDDIKFDFSDDEKYKQANELRNIIGKIPNLAIYIDEVHHAVDEDIKLRKVVTHWTANNTFNAVIGFSGTPYLEKAEAVTLANQFNIKNIELTNVVYYYPLIDGIDNFLKKPSVKISSDNNSLSIVEQGVRDFLSVYKDTRYADGTIAKLAIYCGNIENLEENIYPKVAEIATEYGLNSGDAILKFHKGNSTYKITQEAETEFVSLDLPISKKQIILLVQIGKEGWDCRSLTGVILSQKGDCPTNMTLQTSCRCLRQVDRGQRETALIWLNRFNADTLNKQLQQQQDITLEEFSTKSNAKALTELKRYSRMDTLKVPPIDFYQLKVRYDTLIIEEKTDTAAKLQNAVSDEAKENILIEEQNLQGEIINRYQLSESGEEQADFNQWLYLIVKESFGFVTMNDLKKQEDILRQIFSEITYLRQGIETPCYKNECNQSLIRSNIRKAFYEKREIKMIEEIIPQKAALLNIKNFTTEIQTENPDAFKPEQPIVERIINADNGKIGGEISDATNQEIARLAIEGKFDEAKQLREQNSDVPERKFTYHYLPYRFDSSFEWRFLKEVLSLQDFKNKGLEIYFNGDDNLTDFQIACHKKQNQSWKYIGKYIPDFLIIKRKDNAIYQAIIIETKGGVYAEKFKDKRDFMTEFIRKNNAQFNYNRFDFLYLEDSQTESQRIEKTIFAINKFFNS
jgi:superfamily II DNA or RNA helicase